MVALAEQRIDALFAVLLGAALLIASLRLVRTLAARHVDSADARALAGADASRAKNANDSTSPSDMRSA